MSFEEKVKASFEKVREEMNLLRSELSALRNEIVGLRDIKTNLNNEINNIKTNFNTQSSIGNQGVPANQHTNTSSDNTPSFPLDAVSPVRSNLPTHNPAQTPTHPQHIQEIFQQSNTSAQNSAQESNRSSKNEELTDLNSLIETLKTDMRKKFKSLTKQEFHIFSVLYSVDKSQNQVTYQDLAVRTGLTASSIRDYIQRIVRKGVPILKEKQNNELITLKIPLELRNLATLDSLMRLRKEFPDGNLNQFTN